MKAKLVPLYLVSATDNTFVRQLENLKVLLKEEADISEPRKLGDSIPDCDAVVFPQILGESYRMAEKFRNIPVPILIITSEFGTHSMWDWEVKSFLAGEGVKTIAPYRLEDTKDVCRALAAKRSLSGGKFLIFQDNPGEGFQPDIFKCFYWWEDRCTERMKDRFGVTIRRKSFQEFGSRAAGIGDHDARAVLKSLDFPHQGLSERALLSAVKVYMALKDELEAEDSVIGMGINCLNESRFSDTTPCLAWNLLFQERGLMWVCEGDTMSLLTQYILYNSLKAPLFMTNIYPFLMGQAALKHEGIPNFPEIVDNPENHILLAHCGYFGLLPRCFSCDWSLKPKALGIVDENAHMMDARMQTGPFTFSKIGPTMDRIMTSEGRLKGYVQYPGSDCRNGGIVEIADGHRFMKNVYSHHLCVLQGHREHQIDTVATIFGLETQPI